LKARRRWQGRWHSDFDIRQSKLTALSTEKQQAAHIRSGRSRSVSKCRMRNTSSQFGAVGWLPSGNSSRKIVNMTQSMRYCVKDHRNCHRVQKVSPASHNPDLAKLTVGIAKCKKSRLILLHARLRQYFPFLRLGRSRLCLSTGRTRLRKLLPSHFRRELTAERRWQLLRQRWQAPIQSSKLCVGAESVLSNVSSGRGTRRFGS
jgi:hypothetical protein